MFYNRHTQALIDPEYVCLTNTLPSLSECQTRPVCLPDQMLDICKINTT